MQCWSPDAPLIKHQGASLACADAVAVTMMTNAAHKTRIICRTPFCEHHGNSIIALMAEVSPPRPMTLSNLARQLTGAVLSQRAVFYQSLRRTAGVEKALSAGS